ncbi:MAG: beta-N-acetylglucosaminidase [Nitrospirae bacterium RIFCSPLOWO2_01_FULL_62_17]|nr:MAG: beta-N-acetylglucosaminidase [Nitrospirae bacterium RIFCSPLOWO2_01_FULL_62_17]
MNLVEQIGQLFMLGFDGTTVSSEWAGLQARYKPGGMILFARNLEQPAQIIELTNSLQARSPHFPLLIAIDQEGGRVSRLPEGFTIFPPCGVIGACRSEELAYAAASITAAELRAVGVNMNMAPVLDVHSNPDNPVIGDRAYGTEPAIVAELGLAAIRGLQGKGVVACGKHFPGHGDTSTDSHKELPVVKASLEMLLERELPPFHYAIANGLASLMTAHVVYPALDAQRPATLSPAILTGLLREQWGFDGVIVTDDLEMHAIVDHHGIGDAAVQAFLSGADILLICKDRDRAVTAMEAVRKAVEDGTIPPDRLEASVRRIMHLKQTFLHSHLPADPSLAQLVVGCRTHQLLLDTIRRTHDRIAKA